MFRAHPQPACLQKLSVFPFSHKIGCIEEEIPDRLEMKVSSCGPDALETDCVCEMVDQDKSTKQYVCSYQMTNGATNRSEITPPPTGQEDQSDAKTASIIEGKFALNLPYVNSF